MELAVHRVDDAHVIMLACANGSEKNTKRVSVRIELNKPETPETPETPDAVRDVHFLLMTNDVLLFVVDSAKGSDITTFENAAEENGCGTVPPCIVIAALKALDPAFSLTCDELMAMTKPVPEDYYYDYRGGGGDGGDYDDDDGDDGTVGGDDKSNDGNHGDDDNSCCADLDEPMLPHNGHCGNCFTGKLVKVKITDGKYRLSMRRCVICGQGA